MPWAIRPAQAADAAFANSGSLHPLNLVQVVAPYLFATRVVGQNTHELGLYFGAVPLLLCVWLLRNRSAVESLSAADRRPLWCWDRRVAVWPSASMACFTAAALSCRWSASFVFPAGRSCWSTGAWPCWRPIGWQRLVAASQVARESHACAVAGRSGLSWLASVTGCQLSPWGCGSVFVE